MATYGDNLDRADSDALGTPWVESESDAGVLRILGGRLSARPSIGGVAHGGWAYYDAAYGADQESSLQVTDQSPYRARLAVRGSGAYTSFTGYVLTVPSIPNQLTIQRFEGVNLQTGAGTITNVATVPVSALAEARYLLLAVGTLLRVYRNGILMLEGTDAVVASGKAGCAVVGAAGASEGKADDWRGGDTHAATAWGFHDSAPVPLAMQFDGAPAAWTGDILDIAPLSLALQYAAAAAPWIVDWWGPPDLFFTAVAETPVSAQAVQFWESLLGISSPAAQPWEALAGVAGQGAQPWEAMARAATEAAQPWEALAPASAQATQFWEALVRAAAEASQPWEALARAASEHAQPWEALGRAVSLAGQPWEAAAQVAATAAQFWENLRRAAAEAFQPWEALARAALDVGQPWEAVAAATIQASQQWEAFGILTALGEQFWEAGSAAPPPAGVPKPHMDVADAAVEPHGGTGRVSRHRPDFAATRRVRGR